MLDKSDVIILLAMDGPCCVRGFMVVDEFIRDYKVIRLGSLSRSCSIRRPSFWEEVLRSGECRAVACGSEVSVVEVSTRSWISHNQRFFSKPDTTKACWTMFYEAFSPREARRTFRKNGFRNCRYSRVRRMVQISNERVCNEDGLVHT